MLNNELKSQIQQAYSNFLEAKGLKPRYGQRLMIAEIAKVFGTIATDDKGQRVGDSAIIAVEAGTGTGKTVAYSIAAIPCAQFEEKQLIISTATVALQEQIIYKDLPDIAKHTNLNFTYALAKGRGRYLCLTKLDRLLQEDQYTSDSLFEETLENTNKLDIKLYKSMLDKLASGKWDGDRDGWKEIITDEEWHSVTTEHSQCTNRLCTNFQQCPFFKARTQLDDVDIIVTNHDMVLADLALGGGVVLPAPQQSLYIFDEGHHLADKAINHFAHFTRLQSTTDWLDQTSKTLTKLLKQFSPSGDFGRILEKIPELITPLREQQHFMLNACMGLFSIPEAKNSDNQEAPRYRFNHGIVPENLLTIATELKKGFASLVDCLSHLTDLLKQAMDGKINLSLPSYIAEDWYPAFGALLSRAENNWELWTAFTVIDKEDKPPHARWLTLYTSGNYLDIEVNASPILAADTLRQSLWNTAHGALLTSATLTALGKFDRLIMRAGLPDSTVTCIVPSPFQYEQAGLLQVPNLKADPRDVADHTAAIIKALPELTQDYQGSLVLFSSRKQMQDVYAGLTNTYQESILVQSSLSKQELLKQHKTRIDKGLTSILFGLASLAEGVDLPGEYCEHVIIAKIPFAVPDDPIEAALAEWIEKRGGNPFMEITVPDASLRLIQACGRLIRTEQDKGTITLLDRRIINKSYGKALLNALPPFRREIH
ncbi:ATP-dependent DNA helicase DinG [Entomomonas sp. E2T0]|uniref:ATP-dependent DNA helicase DinG n=1 Tax=Entomomonas sp. E2T0 TaxID=2930213 RepID=UPI0022281DF4|nr:ATP-dependent DNA helicase DinG [Entomomonas sp. E2T0]UYZ83233.1 ATP-dependent DNA helicase DinG [Entomomonas sp. E2T0]